MSTTIAVSEALKKFLEGVASEDEDIDSLNDTILHVIRAPTKYETDISGYEETLTERVWVTKYTQEEVGRIRDEEGFSDYEGVIRERAGLPPRDTGEEPIDVSPLT